MSNDSNGYDAKGEIDALNARVGEWEGRQIQHEAKTTRVSEESAQFRADFYSYRNETREWRQKHADTIFELKRTIEGIAEAVAALTAR